MDCKWLLLHTPLKNKEPTKQPLCLYLRKRAKQTRKPQAAKSHDRGPAHQTPTQADHTKGNKWWLFVRAIQFHGILHFQLLPASVTAYNGLSLTYSLPIHLHRNGGQDRSCSSVDIIHSWDGNIDLFYKELRWEGNCFSFHARLKSRLPLQPAESTWNKKKAQYTVQTCTRDFLVLGQSSCPVHTQAAFVSDIWAVGCTFGHKSRTVWKERCSKKKKKRPQIHSKTAIGGKNYSTEKTTTTLYRSGTQDTLWDRPELHLLD